MSKMREAFFKYYGVKWGVSTNCTAKQDFEAGYQAAIADVKAGGAVAWMDSCGFPHHLSWLRPIRETQTPLYKLPEDV